MKIAIIALHFAEYSVSLAKALAQDNEVLILVHGPNFQDEVGNIDLVSNEPSLKVVFLPHSRTLRVLLGNIVRIVREVRSFSPDVLHIQEEPKDYLMGALPFLRRFPVVLTVHDPAPHSGVDEKLHTRSRRSVFVENLRKRASGIIVHGEKLRQVAIEKKIKRVDRVYSVNHGALGKIFNVGFNDDWKSGHCLFFGRIEAYKGLGVFIEAIKLLRSQGVAVRGIVAGRGTELQRHEADLADSSAFEVIRRYLSVEEVLGVFQEANVVVLPYLEATQSGVSAYAVGIGRAVVATRVGGLPESVQEGVTGLLVEPASPHALADAIGRIVQDRELAKNFARASYNWGEGELSWRTIATQTARVYREVVGKA